MSDDVSDDVTTDGAADGKVEVTESARETAAEMVKAYEDRPTAVLPGSGNTVAGTAVNDWLDDDGNPKFADNAPERE